MATTTLVGLAARAWGLPGRVMVRGGWEGAAVLWMWRVLSQEAEMRRAGERGGVSGCVSVWVGGVLTVFGAVDDTADGL